MTKQDFIALGDFIRRQNGYPCAHKFTDEQVHALADFCQSRNSKFKRERWLDYIAGKCGVNGGTK